MSITTLKVGAIESNLRAWLVMIMTLWFHQLHMCSRRIQKFLNLKSNLRELGGQFNVVLTKLWQCIGWTRGFQVFKVERLAHTRRFISCFLFVSEIIRLHDIADHPVCRLSNRLKQLLKLRPALLWQSEDWSDHLRARAMNEILHFTSALHQAFQQA